MTRKMVVQKMQQFLPESEKAVTTRSFDVVGGRRARTPRYRGCGAGKGFGV